MALTASQSIRHRVGTRVMSRRAYLRTVALFTLVQAFLIVSTARISYTQELSWQIKAGAGIAALACMFVFVCSRRPLLISSGVAGMSLSIGLVVGSIASLQSTAEVMQAVVVTAFVVVLMSLAGITFPELFDGWGPYLISALWVLIAVLFMQARLAGSPATSMPFVNWVGVLLFAAYVAYDWTQAAKAPATLENAIWASGLLILDAANIFVRVLEASSPRSSSSDSQRHQ